MFLSHGLATVVSPHSHSLSSWTSSLFFGRRFSGKINSSDFCGQSFSEHWSNTSVRAMKKIVCKRQVDRPRPSAVASDSKASFLKGRRTSQLNGSTRRSDSQFRSFLRWVCGSFCSGFVSQALCQGVEWPQFKSPGAIYQTSSPSPPPPEAFPAVAPNSGTPNELGCSLGLPRRGKIHHSAEVAVGSLLDQPCGVVLAGLQADKPCVFCWPGFSSEANALVLPCETLPCPADRLVPDVFSGF